MRKRTYCGVFKEPVQFGELTSEGKIFETQDDLDDLPEEIFDEDDIDSSYYDSDSDDEKQENIVSPWLKSFNELRDQMIKINEDIYKKIIYFGNAEAGYPPEYAKVNIKYDAFWEYSSEPFDSTKILKKTKKFYCGIGETLPGIDQAVRTMYKGEISQFVISYHLLFGEMGCPPRIKQKADGLFVIELIDFIKTANINEVGKFQEIPPHERRKFSYLINTIKELHSKANDFFRKGNMRNAISIYRREVKALEFCSCKDENESNEQEKLLIKLYTNLAICYNYLNLPKKACSMCNEIKRITNINKHCKALFQEGRAKFGIGLYAEAKKILERAQSIEPNNKEIKNELALLNGKYKNYLDYEQNMWKRAMKFKANAEDCEDKQDNGIISNNLSEYDETKLQNELQEVSSNSKDEEDSNQLSYLDVTPKVMDTATEFAKEFNLKFTLEDK